MAIRFLDLQQQYKIVRKEFLKKIDSLMQSSDFILGKEVQSFEREFARFTGSRFAVGVNSGTDALFLTLKCLNIGSGDEVIVPAFTFIATSFVVSHTGARPVFVDIDPSTYALDTARVQSALTKRTKAIIPVHLFGLCANMANLNQTARKFDLAVIEDAAQAHGAKIGKNYAGTMGDFGCFSFYPTKNLSGFGDGGMITTNSLTYYQKLLSLRDCGRGKERYLHQIIGYNSRLDSAQALFLRLKLRNLNRCNQARIANAKLYLKLLEGTPNLILPTIPKGFKHVFHVFAIRTPLRRQLIETLKRNKIPSSIFYPLPLHLQPANHYLGYKKGDFPVAEKTSKEILALPIHPALKKTDIEFISSIIRKVHYA